MVQAALYRLVLDLRSLHRQTRLRRHRPGEGDIERHIEEQLHDAVGDLYRCPAEAVERVSERLEEDENGKPLVFRDTMISNIRDLVDMVPRLNIFGDQWLALLCEQVKARIASTEPLSSVTWVNWGPTPSEWNRAPWGECIDIAGRAATVHFRWIPDMNVLLILSDGHSRETAGRYGPGIRSANLNLAVPYSVCGQGVDSPHRGIRVCAGPEPAFFHVTPDAKPFRGHTDFAH